MICLMWLFSPFFRSPGQWPLLGGCLVKSMGDREGVSSGDEKVTGSPCCCRNLQLDTAMDIGLPGKWSDPSNREVSNIYLRLFSPVWLSGNSMGSPGWHWDHHDFHGWRCWRAEMIKHLRWWSIRKATQVQSSYIKLKLQHGVVHSTTTRSITLSHYFLWWDRVLLLLLLLNPSSHYLLRNTIG